MVYCRYTKRGLTFLASYPEILPTDILPMDILPTDILPTNILAADILPTNILAADILPMDSLPTNILAADSLPTDILPMDSLPTNALSEAALEMLDNAFYIGTTRTFYISIPTAYPVVRFKRLS